jgi:hypothetical protein
MQGRCIGHRLAGLQDVIDIPHRRTLNFRDYSAAEGNVAVAAPRRYVYAPFWAGARGFSRFTPAAC